MSAEGRLEHSYLKLCECFLCVYESSDAGVLQNRCKNEHMRKSVTVWNSDWGNTKQLKKVWEWGEKTQDIIHQRSPSQQEKWKQPEWHSTILPASEKALGTSAQPLLKDLQHQHLTLKTAYLSPEWLYRSYDKKCTHRLGRASKCFTSWSTMIIIQHVKLQIWRFWSFDCESFQLHLLMLCHLSVLPSRGCTLLSLQANRPCKVLVIKIPIQCVRVCYSTETRPEHSLSRSVQRTNAAFAGTCCSEQS